MKASAQLITLFILFFSNPVFAEQANFPSTSSEKFPPRENSIEFEYRLFSPELLFHSGHDIVSMTPKNAGQPGLRFTRGNFNFAFNKSVFSNSSQSDGFDLGYSWDNSFVQAYHVWAKGYQVRLNPDSKNKVNLGSRDDMTGSSEGLLFLKGFDESSNFSMMTNRGPRDDKFLETPIQYIYQILIDRSTFQDSTALVAGSTVKGKERTSFLPGVGAMTSQSMAAGYVFSTCSLGLGVLEEKMANTTGNTEQKSDGVYAISCLMNLVLQKAAANVEAKDSRWYGGMSGNVQLIQPFDQNLLGQRMFLVSVFVGAQF
jgi:hypothetical protein